MSSSSRTTRSGAAGETEATSASPFTRKVMNVAASAGVRWNVSTQRSPRQRLRLTNPWLSRHVARRPMPRSSTAITLATLGTAGSAPNPTPEGSRHRGPPSTATRCPRAGCSAMPCGGRARCCGGAKRQASRPRRRRSGSASRTSTIPGSRLWAARPRRGAGAPGARRRTGWSSRGETPEMASCPCSPSYGASTPDPANLADLSQIRKVGGSPRRPSCAVRRRGAGPRRGCRP
jgi:hypothetical protein